MSVSDTDKSSNLKKQKVPNIMPRYYANEPLINLSENAILSLTYFHIKSEEVERLASQRAMALTPVAATRLRQMSSSAERLRSDFVELLEFLEDNNISL